jgi:xylulokinase
MSYLGIDVGTSRTKAVAYDDAFHALAESSVAYERICPQRGWYEIDAAGLGRAVHDAIAKCSAQCRRDPIRWLACSVFGGGVLAIDAQLRPLLNIISTTDPRAQPQADQWHRQFGRERTYHITGTTTHPSLMLPKALWIAAHLEQPQRIAQFVTAAEFVQAVLGVRPHMDLATASTTMLLDINQRRWSEEILAAAHIAVSQLPELIEPGAVIDTLPSALCSQLGLAPGCALVAGGHDQQVCALGAGLLEPGEATDSLGTVECITTLFGRPQLCQDLLESNFSNLLHVYGGRVATLAYNFSAGDLFHWVRHTLFPGPPSFDAMFEKLPPRPARVLALPHFAGSGTPHLDAQSKGLLIGLTLQTTPGEILRGVVDSMNYEMRLNLDVWRRHDISFDCLRAYGKGASCDSVLQIKADVLELEVQRLDVAETGCLGAALLAARAAAGDFPIADVARRIATVQRRFAPRSEFTDAHRQVYEIYQQLYPQTRELVHKL